MTADRTVYKIANTRESGMWRTVPAETVEMIRQDERDRIVAWLESDACPKRIFRPSHRTIGCIAGLIEDGAHEEGS